MSESAKKTASSIAKRMLDTKDNLWDFLKDALIEAGYPKSARDHHNCKHSINYLTCIVLGAVSEGEWDMMDAWEYGASLR